MTSCRACREGAAATGGCAVQPRHLSPRGCLYLSDADLLQAEHLGAVAHPAGQGHLQDFAVICEGSGRRSCQGWEPPNWREQRTHRLPRGGGAP